MALQAKCPDPELCVRHSVKIQQIYCIGNVGYLPESVYIRAIRIATTMDAQPTCTVIGAGIAGLLAADTLARHGCKATILEKARGVGGRMATRRAGEHSFDFGAQFLAARTPHFQSLLTSWQASGLLAEWHPDVSRIPREKRHPGPFYRGVPAMTAVPKSLASGLTVELRKQVTAVRISQDAWSIETSRGDVYMSQALLITSPVPQTLAMLEAGNVPIPPEILTQLLSIKYVPCFALMLVLDGPAGLPDPGAMALDGDPLAWITDNHTKGVDALPGSVTVYAGEVFSNRMFDEPAEHVTEVLLGAVRTLLTSSVVSTQLHRWRYSQPIRTLQVPFLAARETPPLVLAGEAFGGGDCESAALSGIAAARYLHSTFCPTR